MLKKSTKISQIYLIGIKGVGTTMLAQFLTEMGNNLVSGSDINDVFLTDKVLKTAKIKVFSPFDSKNIPLNPDLIIYSSAYNENNNSELAYIKNNPALFKKTRLLSYASALGEVFNQYQGVAVCGSHGKTTTSAWLGYVLLKAGKKPNVLVGSRVPQFKGSSLKGSSKYFVAETDEYQNKLQYFKPQGVLLNNIDYDHPDFFPTKEAYLQVFIDFIKKIKASGFLVLNNQDLESLKIKKYCRGRILTYAIDSEADYQARELVQKNNRLKFKLVFKRKIIGSFTIKMLGRHNVSNALAVIAAARELKVSFVDIKKHLATFKGTERRAQILGKYRGALIIDDYAHHPTEVKATLAGLRLNYDKQRIITVFHPHTFTRTKALFADFIKSFRETDELIVLDIYGSAREIAGGVSSRELVEAIISNNQKENFKQNVKYLAAMPEAVKYLKSHLKKQDILLLMGAGDVFRIGQDLLKNK